MLLSTPPLSPTQPNPTPTPEAVQSPPPNQLDFGGDLRTLSQPERSFLSCFGCRGWGGGRGRGGYFTKLVSIQIANFHMVLAEIKRKRTCEHSVSAVNPSAWLISKWFSSLLFLFRKESMNEWMTSFIRPGAGLHVKVTQLPPAYGNVFAFSLV